MVAVRKDSPKARPTCSTTPRAKSPRPVRLTNGQVIRASPGRGSKLGIDATKKIPGEGFKRPWPPLIKMDAAVKAKVEKLFNP